MLASDNSCYLPMRYLISLVANCVCVCTQLTVGTTWISQTKKAGAKRLMPKLIHTNNAPWGWCKDIWCPRVRQTFKVATPTTTIYSKIWNYQQQQNQHPSVLILMNLKWQIRRVATVCVSWFIHKCCCRRQVSNLSSASTGPGVLFSKIATAPRKHAAYRRWYIIIISWPPMILLFSKSSLHIQCQWRTCAYILIGAVDAYGQKPLWCTVRLVETRSK